MLLILLVLNFVKIKNKINGNGYTIQLFNFKVSYLVSLWSILKPPDYIWILIIGFIYDIDKGKTRNFGNYYPNSLLKYPELGDASILEPFILSLERTHKTCGFLITIFGFSMSYIYLKIIWWNLEGKYCSLIISWALMLVWSKDHWRQSFLGQLVIVPPETKDPFAA